MSAFSAAADDEDGDTINALRAENEQLRTAIARLHAARGRYHTQLAACDLFELCGLPNERPKK